MAKTSQLFEHTQRYVREVMADRLRSEGFVSYKDEDIHWYRLVDNEVIHAVYFITRSTALNSFFDIRYGCHPLFIPPVFQKSPYLREMLGYEQMNDRVPELLSGSTDFGFHGLMLLGLFNRPYRVPDVLINCPRDKHDGLDVLEPIFPFMDTLRTPNACYKMHKARREREIENGNMVSMSAYFVDEVLFWDDRELHPYCREYIKNRMFRLRYLQETGGRSSKLEQQELGRIALLSKVFEEGCQQEYLQTFDERSKRTLELLEKYTVLRR